MLFQYDKFKHQQGEDSADRVDHYPFPAQHLVDIGVGSHHPHQRGDHRRAGDHRYRTDQRRQFGRKVQQPPAGHANHQEGHQHADGYQVAHYATQATNFLDTQRQRAFEQNNGDRQRH
ncbi:hypothetical protein D3C81_1496530 [compost metagenome]